MIEPAKILERIAQAQAGDAKAFDELCGAFRDGVFSYALAVLGDFHLAQDVTQETLVTAYFALPRLEEPLAFGRWLNTIARHQVNRLLRRRDLQYLPSESLDLFADSASHALRETDASELLGTVKFFLDGLTSLDREIVRLFYLNDCSQREAAAFLRLPVTTINNRLHAARRIMKERISAMTQRNATTSTSEDRITVVGEIVRIDGPVIDVQFAPNQMPDIFDAFVAPTPSGMAAERMKVAQRRANGLARSVATTDAADLKVGQKVMNTGNVGVGLTPWVGVAPMSDANIRRVVRRPQSAKPQLLESGIKAIDLLCPLTAGGSVALFGIQGVGRIVLVEELMRRLGKAEALRIFHLVEPNESDSVRGMLTTEKEYPGDVVGNVEVMWLLTESATDPDFAAANDLFDAALYCSPLMAIQGLYPAIDPLISRSNLLRADVVGAEHFDIAMRVREAIAKGRALMTDPRLLELLACRARGKARERVREFAEQRRGELSGENLLIVSRARKLERFLTTPFFVAESFSKRPGEHVSVHKTIAGCRQILGGDVDERPEDSLLFIGEIGHAA